MDYLEEENSYAESTLRKALDIERIILIIFAWINYKRDKITNEMWIDYVNILLYHGMTV